MLQLKDETPFASALAVHPDPQGIDTLYVTTKATFSLGERVGVADEQLPLTLSDEYWGEPGQSSLKYASELHLSKPTTDVALVGSARAPGGRPVAELDVALRVGPVQKEIRVVGDRTWTGSLFGSSTTAAEPFETMPLVWERAFGGVHLTDAEAGTGTEVPENPVGRGFRGKRRRGALKGEAAPNLLDPKDPKLPACFGFVAAGWEPRRSHAGTYDAAWQKSRAPYLPADFDARFFNAASPDLVCPEPLRGGEPVSLTNLSPHGEIRFRLPTVVLDVSVSVSGRAETLEPRLETVLLEPDDERMSLVWRSALACDKEALAIEEVAVAMAACELDGPRP